MAVTCDFSMRDLLDRAVDCMEECFCFICSCHLPFVIITYEIGGAFHIVVDREINISSICSTKLRSEKVKGVRVIKGVTISCVSVEFRELWLLLVHDVKVKLYDLYKVIVLLRYFESGMLL